VLDQQPWQVPSAGHPDAQRGVAGSGALVALLKVGVLAAAGTYPAQERADAASVTTLANSAVPQQKGLSMAAGDARNDESSDLPWRSAALPSEPGRTRTVTRPASVGGITNPTEETAEPWSAARWRRESGKIAAFVVVLAVLEGANWYLLSAAFAWVLPGKVLPGLAAFALIVVLVGTMLSRTLLDHPALRAHRVRLRITLIGLIALQFMVNTVEGFILARVTLPVAVAQFFQLDPMATARIIGMVLGGSLALITFSYLLLVAQIIEEILPLPDLRREAEVLLRRYERAGARRRTMGGPPLAPTDPTIALPTAREDRSDTVPATRFWGALRQQRGRA
jgi:hypothetical protein